MRAALLKRRRRGPSLPARIKAALELEPLLLVPLLPGLTWQDPAGIQKAGIGDPIGAAQCLVTGALFVQTSDASRPVLTADGGEFDGGQLLRREGSFSLVPDEPITIISRASRGADGFVSVVAWSWGSLQAEMGINLRGASNRRAQLILGGSDAGLSSNEAYPLNGLQLITGRSNGTASELRLNGDQIATGSPGGNTPGPGDVDEITIGAWGRSDASTPTHFWSGLVEFVSIYDRALSDSEIMELM